MSGETANQESGWTVDTLHTHFIELMREKTLRDEQRYEAQQLALREALIGQEKAVNAALAAAEKAVTKAEIAAEKRFDNVNEFRGQLSDQAATFMPRTEADVRLNAMKEQIDRVEGAARENVGRDHATTRSSERVSYYIFASLAFLVGATGLLLSIIR